MVLRVSLNIPGSIYFVVLIKLLPGDNAIYAEIKNWATHANLGVLINQLRGMPGEGILIADYVNPNMAERLREEEIQYIDTAGNAYINQPGQFVFIKGNAAPGKDRKKTKQKGQRAFEPTALKVVYVFLCYEWMLNQLDRTIADQPYRAIAKRAGVAVGTVGWVINALKEGGFIRDTGPRGRRKLVNHRQLLDRWVEAWPRKLKPKLHLGEFQTEDTFWWEDFGQYETFVQSWACPGWWSGPPRVTSYYSTVTERRWRVQHRISILQ